MSCRRITLALPKDVSVKLERMPNKGAYVLDAIREKLRRDEHLAKIQREGAREESSTEDWELVSAESL